MTTLDSQIPPSRKPRNLPPPITLTEAAQKRIETLTRDKEGIVGLRVSLKSRGCAGLSYTYELASAILPSDITIACGETHLLIDREAEMFLIGSTLDFQKNDFGEAFSFNNPNEAGRCGCGESFTPKT